MPARTYRDAYGVPHIRADSVLELAREQGGATARDRAWQLEYQRRRATGTTAEVLGRPQLAWDVLARRVRVPETAQRAYAALSPEAQAFVAAYSEGVNDTLPTAGARSTELRRLGLEPGRWEPWTPLAVFHAQHVLFASLVTKLWHQHARSVLGPDERLLSRDPAYAMGSNAWAVGGARTASGLPLIGGDSHRLIESPGVYTQVRLACEDPADEFDVIGFTFPGVPGIQHFGHTGEVAWAITNAASDYQDALAEAHDAVIERREELVAVRGADPVAIEVAQTARGPVFQVDEDRVLTFLDSATVLGDVGFEALLPLLRARTVTDIGQALDHWVEPVNNVIVADRSGGLQFRYAGRVPVRSEANRQGIVEGSDPATEWSGWVDLPAHEIPADGGVVTANDRRGAESDPIGTEFAPPHRAVRIATLLEGRDDLTPADFAAIHGDALTAMAAAVSPLVASLDPGPAGAEVQRRILEWDGRAQADSEGAAAFAAWRTAVTRRIVADPVFAPLLEGSPYGPVFAPYLDLEAHVGLALERLLLIDRPFGIDVRPLASAALDDAADQAETWGDIHVLDPTHGFDLADDDLEAPTIPRTPLSGDIDTVLCTGWLPAITDECYRGSVTRYVWDLSDRERSAWVVPLGAAGDPSSPHHHDQLQSWARVELLPIVTDWSRLTLDEE